MVPLARLPSVMGSPPGRKKAQSLLEWSQFKLSVSSNDSFNICIFSQKYIHLI
jgi:hypothetical protein